MASLTLLHHHQQLFFISLLLSSPLLSSSSSSSSHPDSVIPTLSSSPASLTDPPLSSPISPFPQLSPDIAPLLPSPGGVLPTPTGSDIPTIPSSPSPPNPDDDGGSVAPGPLSAFSPFGLFQAASHTPATLASSGSAAMAVSAGFVAYWFIMCRV